MSGVASGLSGDGEVGEARVVGTDDDISGPRCCAVHIHGSILARLYNECPL